MPVVRTDRVREMLRGIAAKFFLREAGPRSLITVTDATISSDLKRATIYITTFPDSEQEKALAFAKRKRSDLREYLREQAKLRFLPVLEIKIDEGERNRQKIDSLLKQG